MDTFNSSNPDPFYYRLIDSNVSTREGLTSHFAYYNFEMGKASSCVTMDKRYHTALFAVLAISPCLQNIVDTF